MAFLVWAKLVLEQTPACFPRFAHIWADGGYAGQLVSWVKECCQQVLEMPLLVSSGEPPSGHFAISFAITFCRSLERLALEGDA